MPYNGSRILLRGDHWHGGMCRGACSETSIDHHRHANFASFWAKSGCPKQNLGPKDAPWKHPGCKVRIWGPAADVSLTEGGVVVQDQERRWMRTTLARPVMDPEVDEEGAITGKVQASNHWCGKPDNHGHTPGRWNKAGWRATDTTRFQHTAPGWKSEKMLNGWGA